MKKALLLVGFWTVSMAVNCQGAESKKLHQPLMEWRTVINMSSVSATSKELQRGSLKKMIEDELNFGKKINNIKARRALSSLQHKVEQDRNPKSGRKLF